jgi:xylulokinase
MERCRREKTVSLMGLDIGTTGCKAVAFDERGKILSSAYEEYPLRIPHQDQCELDPEEVWSAIRAVIAKTAGEVKKRDPVRALGISTLGDSVTPIGAGGEPVGNTIVGAADRRATAQAAWIEGKKSREEIFELTGAPLHAYCAIPKIMWLREHKLRMFEKAEKFSGWQEIVHRKLGLEPAMDYSLASRTMLMNMNTLERADDLLNLCGLNRELFYPLAPSNHVTGRLDLRGSIVLGLEKGVTVVTGGFDQCCCALGGGVLEPGTAALTLGTLVAVTAVYDQRRLELPLLEGNHGCGCHVQGGLYFSLAYVTSAGSILRWYRDNLGMPETDRARALRRDPYDVIVDAAPDRPSSVFLLPYFTGTGTPWLDVHQKGTLFGLTLDTDRGEIVKAILDGICFEVRLNLESMGRAGLRYKTLRTIGGGAKSDRWMQLAADVTGIPVEVTEVTEAGSLGAAFLAGQGVGAYSSLDDLRAITNVRKVFEPRPEQGRQYDERYEAYKGLRERVKGLRL